MPRTIIKSSPISEAISRRFFVAIDALVTYRLVGSLDGFCNEYQLSAPRYREMRGYYGLEPKSGRPSRYKNIEIEAAYYLVAKYPVSPNWLLTGRGRMLTRKIIANEV